MDIPKGFYVYTLSEKLSDGSLKIFYVGKGSGKRINAHEADARRGHKCHKCNKIRKMWRLGKEVIRTIVFVCDSEEEAYAHEEKLVATIGLYKLTNRQPGGGRVQYHYHLYRDRSLWSLTEDEYRNYLRHMPKRWSKKAFEDQVLRWLEQKLYRLTEERREARRFGRDMERAAEIDIEIAALLRRIMPPYQNKLPI